MHICHIVGARPNFMKAAPVIRALQQRANIKQTLVHTGQHYDANMSGVFFAQLGIPEPDVNLEVGSGSHAEQTAAVMSRFEPVLLQKKPDIVLVYGDVNSTVATALVDVPRSIPTTAGESTKPVTAASLIEVRGLKKTYQLGETEVHALRGGASTPNIRPS